ncbi:MAG: VanZ family protein [Anaerolineae bacterium]|nr:VanZ family protein [Phycisphaerae bacterium]
MPPRHVPPVPVNDKIEHFAGFAILAILLTIAINGRTSYSPARIRGGVARGEPSRTGRGAREMLRPFAIALAICLIYGALDEWTQPFVGRTCDLHDWLADAGGAMVGSLIGLTIVRRFSPFAAAPVER